MNSWLKFALGIGGSVLLYSAVFVILDFSDKVGIHIPNRLFIVGLVALTIPFVLVAALIILVVMIVKFVKNRKSILKKCLFCAELIQPEAIVCHFCGRDLVK